MTTKLEMIKQIIDGFSKTLLDIDSVTPLESGVNLEITVGEGKDRFTYLASFRKKSDCEEWDVKNMAFHGYQITDKERQFTFELVGATIESKLEDKLFEAGCDDALIHYQDNKMFLSFDRMAPTMEEAMESASKQIGSVWVTEVMDIKDE